MPPNESSALVRITHRTVYRYGRPVSFQPHRLVLRPREGHDLRVEHLVLNTSPHSEVVWSRDVFGNSIALAHFAQSADELTIESDVTVRRFLPSTSPPIPSLAAALYPVEYDPLEQVVVASYIAPTFPADEDSVRTWLRSASSPDPAPAAAALALELTRRVHSTIAYMRREAKGVQSPSTTLTLRSGSCRDLATLLMESLRHLGFAARFASGYLDCNATRAASGVTHAWTEVYLPDIGWRGYDPTTGNACTHQHIVTGVSNHPRGVMPVTGTFLGPGSAFQGMAVTVTFEAV